MNNANPFVQYGMQLGCILLGEDPKGLTRMMAKEATLQSREAAPYQQELCKIAHAAFVTDGRADCVASLLFRNLAQADEWYPSYNRFTDCVRRGMGKEAGLLPIAAGLHDKTGGGVMKNIFSGGVATGGILGSLAFMLSRNAKQSSSANAELLEKIRAYKQLSKNIEEDMHEHGVMDDGANDKEKRYDV